MDSLARQKFCELAAEFGKHTILAMIDNRPVTTIEFFARLAGHFAAWAVA